MTESDRKAIIEQLAENIGVNLPDKRLDDLEARIAELEKLVKPFRRK